MPDPVPSRSPEKPEPPPRPEDEPPSRADCRRKRWHRRRRRYNLLRPSRDRPRLRHRTNKPDVCAGTVEGSSVPQIFHRSFNTISRHDLRGGVSFVTLWDGAWPSSRAPATSPTLASPGLSPFRSATNITSAPLASIAVFATARSRCLLFQACRRRKRAWRAISRFGPAARCSSQCAKATAPANRSNGVACHRLGEFVYFDHSVHVNKGVGCASCHGPINAMPLTWQHGTLLMEWCLNCHRAPQDYIRPKEYVFDSDWTPESIGKTQVELGKKFDAEYHVGTLIHCSTCHR